jgi:hypothetical protein
MYIRDFIFFGSLKVKTFHFQVYRIGQIPPFMSIKPTNF